MGKRTTKFKLKPHKNTIERATCYQYASPKIHIDGNKYSKYFEHHIEKKENSITFRTYIERTYNLTLKDDVNALEKVFIKQKSPLPQILTEYEAEHRKAAKETILENGLPTDLYSFDDMYEV